MEHLFFRARDEKYKKSQNTRDFLLCTVVGAQRVTKIRLRARVGSFFSRDRSIWLPSASSVSSLYSPNSFAMKQMNVFRLVSLSNAYNNFIPCACLLRETRPR